MTPLVRGLYANLGIEKGPDTPAGVYGRAVDGRTLYVNTTGEEKIVPIRGTRHGVVSGATYERAIRLRPYDVDVVEQEPVHSP